jgi:hypothetical protein
MAHNGVGTTLSGGTWVPLITGDERPLPLEVFVRNDSGSANVAEVYSEGLHGEVSGDDPGAAVGCPVRPGESRSFLAATNDSVARHARVWAKSTSATIDHGTTTA